MTIKKINTIKKLPTAQALFIFGLLGVAGLALLDIPFVNANSSQQINQLQQEINQVQADNNQKQQDKGVLNIEANSLSDAINKLQNDINASQARINQLQAEVDALNKQIADAEAELLKQKGVLGESIKSMYLEGDITTIEMLATSKDLSEFFDKQQYRESVQSKIKTTLDTITKLKLELADKRVQVEGTLSEQKSLASQLAGQRAEKDRILSLNQDQQNQLESQIRANGGKIAELKKKQAAAEAALARSLSSGSFRAAAIGPVSSGDIVGAIGNTGFSTGPHLHLEMRKGNGVVSPSPYIRSAPVNMPPAWVSQGFNAPNSWYRSGAHTGIDYASTSGAPIFAIDGGQLYRGCSADVLGTNAYGYVAIIDHGDGIKSIYAHMSGGPAACNYNTF